MKKLSLLMASILLFSAVAAVLLVLPIEAGAEETTVTYSSVASWTDGAFTIDPDYDAKNNKKYAETGWNLNGTYGNGYMPSGTAMVYIPLPLMVQSIGGGALPNPLNVKLSLTVAASDTVQKPSNASYELKYNSSRGIWVNKKTNDMIKFPIFFKEKAYDGVYGATFSIKYSDGSVLGGGAFEQTFTVYFQITGKPAPSETAAPDKSANSLPKLMVTSYVITPEQIKAGEQMDIKLNIKNTSEKRAAQNIDIKLESADAVFLPVNGTNSAYISKLKPKEEAQLSFSFDVKPAATPGPASITVTMNYEDSAVATTSQTATIAVLVDQPIRTRITDPQVYASTDDQPFTVSLSVYNLGKSTLYNVMADISGDFMQPQGSYFGGTLEPGAKKDIELSAMALPRDNGDAAGDASADAGNADMQIQPREADGMMAKAEGMDSAVAVAAIGGGDIAVDGGSGGAAASTGGYTGKVIITYEDVNGKIFTEEKQFTANVAKYYQQEFTDDPTFNPDEATGPDLTWLWITLPSVAVAGLIVFLVLRNKKRKRIIEDELL